MSAVRQQTLFDTIANADRDIKAGNTSARSFQIDTSYLSRKTFYVITTGFTGTLDLQGSFNGGVTWFNLLYTTRGTTASPSAAQLSYSGDTSSYIYTTDDHVPLISVNLSAGSGTVAVLFFGNEETAPTPNAILTVDTEFVNSEVTLLASALRTTTTQSADQTNLNARGCHVIINVTAASAPSVVFTIQGKDPISGTYYTILDSVAIIATGITIIKVYPGIGAAANAAASDLLPKTWRVLATHGNGNNVTYSVAAALEI